jgi:hypothetical protein
MAATVSRTTRTPARASPARDTVMELIARNPAMTLLLMGQVT